MARRGRSPACGRDPSGGYVRNAALRAAFLAAGDGGVLSQRHLEEAIRLEYRGAGKLSDTGVLE